MRENLTAIWVALFLGLSIIMAGPTASAAEAVTTTIAAVAKADVQCAATATDDCDGDGWCPGGEDLNGDGVCSTADEYYSEDVNWDCDDDDPQVNAGAVEVCDLDATDENCDGIENDVDGYTGEVCDYDRDGSPYSEDCDDANPRLFPGNPELCNGVDDNCNGLISDEEDICDLEESCSTAGNNPASAWWLLAILIPTFLRRREAA